eukprot:493751_1
MSGNNNNNNNNNNDNNDNNNNNNDDDCESSDDNKMEIDNSSSDIISDISNDSILSQLLQMGIEYEIANEAIQYRKGINGGIVEIHACIEYCFDNYSQNIDNINQNSQNENENDIIQTNKLTKY